MTIERFLVILNKVTAYHRHGNVIPKNALDNLCNAQIELENQLQKTAHNGDYAKSGICSECANFKDCESEDKATCPDFS